MKRMTIFIFLIITIVSLAQNAAPRIFAKENSHDFGTIVEGQVVTHNFEIQNTGNADLAIDTVRATCGCTAAAPEKRNLKPGEKTFIKVDFNSENRLGPQEKFVYVFSKDPLNPQYKLSFTCVVVDKNSVLTKTGKSPQMKLSLSQHDFGDVEEGKVVYATVGFKNVGKAQLIINDVITSCGCTVALLSSKLLQPGESGSIKIELDTANREGKLTRTVTLYTNDPGQPNQTITLFINILKRKS